VIDRTRPTFAGSLGWQAVRRARWTVVGTLLATGLVAGSILAGMVGLFTVLRWIWAGSAPMLDFAFARRVVYEVCKWLFVVTLGMLYVDQRPRERDAVGIR
jgi:RsiW-degrading membrane proteinase PrsW (M82 family)